MKAIGLISTAVLALILGVTSSAYAHREQQAEKRDHPQQQKDKREPGKPAHPHAQHPQQRQDQSKHHEQAQPELRGHDKPQVHARERRAESATQKTQHARQSQRQEQTKAVHAQQRNQSPPRTQERQRVEHSAWQQHRSQHWDSDHRTWQQRGGYNGYRIPEDRFRGYFGRDHGFRIYGLPFLVVGGYPRFQYHGYWLSAVDPWPEYWGNNWYDNDDVYVTYVDNGYYLYNRRYPNVGIAISISL